MQTYQKRRLKIKFELSEGSFDGNPENNSVEFSGLRVLADIKVTAGGIAQANIVVFGLAQSIMETLTLVQGWLAPNSLKPNTVALYSVDDVGVESLVFDGTIFQAIADYNGAPNVPLHIMARKMYPMQLVTPDPLSFPGATKVSDIFQGIVDAANSKIADSGKHFTLENNNVTTSLVDVSLSGSIVDMLNKVADQAGIIWLPDGNTIVLSVKGIARATVPALELSAENGLIGYPVTTPSGVLIRALYTPYYRPLGTIKLKSLAVKLRAVQPEQQTTNGSAYYLTEANFTISTVQHKLQSEMPGGLWQTEMELLYKP